MYDWPLLDLTSRLVFGVSASYLRVSFGTLWSGGGVLTLLSGLLGTDQFVSASFAEFLEVHAWERKVRILRMTD